MEATKQTTEKKGVVCLDLDTTNFRQYQSLINYLLETNLLHAVMDSGQKVTRRFFQTSTYRLIEDHVNDK